MRIIGKENRREDENGEDLLRHIGIANARLIAAAPELLEAAKAAASLIRGSGFTEQTEALILLTAAIKKAEGR